MEIIQTEQATELPAEWDQLARGVYQRRGFLSHLQATNPCGQQYYQAIEHGKLIAGAVTYRLKVNLFTYSRLKLNLPMHVIAIPASVDAPGLLGGSSLYPELVEHILNHRRGLVLCLNTDQPVRLPGLVQMDTLPGLVFENTHRNWPQYMQDIRHPYRRRIRQALAQLNGAEKREEPCSAFTQAHYGQYLQIMKRTKTKLEVLSFGFFSRLPDNYRLFSFYDGGKLITWHISCMDDGVYYFVFGGLDYCERDRYDAYQNNLIAIMQEGMERGSSQINFGQTAEISKTRLGAKPLPRKMFVYHHNGLIRGVLNMLRPALTYKTKAREAHIYKKGKA